MPMIKARAWMKDGKVIIDTVDVQYKVDVSILDFATIKAGGVADVEIKVITKNPAADTVGGAKPAAVT